MDQERVDRVATMLKCEVVIIKTDLQRESVYRRLKAVQPDIIVKEADKPGFLIACLGQWPHERLKKRAPNKSGYDPSANLRRGK